MGALSFSNVKFSGASRLLGFISSLPPCLSYILVTFLLYRFLFCASLFQQGTHVLVSPAIFDSGRVKLASSETMSCDYWEGKWVPDAKGPLYNDSCSSIKRGRNCLSHGRPDSDYLYWRWKPNSCSIPHFEPENFLNFLANKHLAFVGDSLARNQIESLICMLATGSTPNLVFKRGDDDEFKRWSFSSHNLTVSLYWSPFLVKGVEKSKSDPNNNLYLDYVDESWASEINSFDVLVLSAGQWYLIPGVYYAGYSRVVGCHICSGANHTEVGFYDAFRKSVRTSLTAIKSRATSKRRLQVFVTTFPPAHFEGDWNNFAACPKTRPFQEGEKDLDSVHSTMRQNVIEEVKSIKLGRRKRNLEFDALDVTKLSLMRPDAHPGPYLVPFPFRDGVKDHVQNDCVHWCLPGAIDTWNEILLELISNRRSYKGGETSFIGLP